MEYYFLAPVGILLSGKERTKEDVFQLLTSALASESKNIVHYLQKEGIQPVRTLVAPRFKFVFDIQNEEIVEMK